MPDFSIRSPDLERLADLFPKAAKQLEREIVSAVEAAAKRGQDEVRRRTPIKTARLYHAISYRVIHNGPFVRAEVYVDPSLGADYADFVEEGTRPHTIFPLTAKVLRFRIGGRFVFARSVNHPGTRGAHMFRDGGAAMEAYADQLLSQAMDRVLKEFL